MGHDLLGHEPGRAMTPCAVCAVSLPWVAATEYLGCDEVTVRGARLGFVGPSDSPCSDGRRWSV